MSKASLHCTLENVGCSAAGNLSDNTRRVAVPLDLQQHSINVHGTVKTLELLRFETEKPKSSIENLKPWFRYSSMLPKNVVSVPILITVTTLQLAQVDCKIKENSSWAGYNVSYETKINYYYSITTTNTNFVSCNLWVTKISLKIVWNKICENYMLKLLLSNKAKIFCLTGDGTFLTRLQTTWPQSPDHAYTIKTNECKNKHNITSISLQCVTINQTIS